MITLYGKRYAKNDSDFIESLFTGDGKGTANGYYKKTAKGVFLIDMQGNQRAFIRRDGLGPVTVTKSNGKDFYMFACTSKDQKWLSVPDSYSEEVNGAEQLAKSVFLSA